MNEEHSSYIIDIKRPTREGYVACLVITPKHRDGHTDVSAKVERNRWAASTVSFGSHMNCLPPAVHRRVY